MLKHSDDKNVFSHIHISLIFFWSLTLVSETMLYIQNEISWKKLILFLNILNWQNVNELKLESDSFFLSETSSQLSENFIMWNQIWNFYHSADFFNEFFIDDEKYFLKLQDFSILCIECCFWLACHLAFVSWFNVLAIFAKFWLIDMLAWLLNWL